MWVNENKESMFYCNEYGIRDLISMLDGDMSFTIGIQIEWQMQKMMIIHGNKKLVSFYVTFCLGQTKKR